jgi:Arc/MetJ family transcription regulator
MTTASRDSEPGRRLGRPRRGWVRKNLHIDQRKLDAARKALGVKTETEAVDAALDAIAFREEISEGVRRVRAAGGLADIYRD